MYCIMTTKKTVRCGMFNITLEFSVSVVQVELAELDSELINLTSTDAKCTDAERTDAKRTDAERTDAKRTDAKRTDAKRTKEGIDWEAMPMSEIKNTKEWKSFCEDFRKINDELEDSDFQVFVNAANNFNENSNESTIGPDENKKSYSDESTIVPATFYTKATKNRSVSEGTTKHSMSNSTEQESKKKKLMD
jgi:hypothetical protein